MYQGYHKKFPSVETLTSTEYLQHLQSQLQLRVQINLELTNQNDTINNLPLYTLVDVRSKPPEQHVSVIPNATTITTLVA